MHVSSLPVWLGVGGPSTISVSPASSSVSEGSSITFNVFAVYPDNTILYFNLNTSASTATTADFTTYSGTFLITNRTGSFTVTLATDLTVESETFCMNVLTGSINGTVIATSSSVSITDTSPTYALAPRASSVNEGSSLTFDVTTTNLTNGTVLYYNLNTSLSTATSADFTSYNGSVTITSNAGTFSVSVANDMFSETEYFYMDLKTGSITGTVVATSSQVTITDVPPTYSVTPRASSVDEGNSLVFDVSTTYVPDSTVLYYNLNASSSASASRFTSVSGSCTITSGVSTFSITTNTNNIQGDGSSFKIDLLLTSITGTIVATSSIVTIVDISNGLSSNPTTGNFLSPVSITYTLKPSNTSGVITVPSTPISPGAGFTNPFTLYPMISGVLGAPTKTRTGTDYFPSLRWTGGMFVARTGTTGVFGYSTDGINWDYIYTGGDIKSMVKSSSLWVAVGASGLVKTSSDTITWTTVTSFTSDTLYDVEWTGTAFIAVGYNGDIFRSTNGTSWSSVLSAGGTTTNPLVAVRYANNALVAVLYSVAYPSGTTFGYKSTNDGVSWTAMTKTTNPAELSYPSAIVYNGSQWLINMQTTSTNRGIPTFMKSSDLITWTGQTGITVTGGSGQASEYPVGPIWTGTNMVYLSRSNTDVIYSSTPFATSTWSVTSYDNKSSTVLLRAVASNSAGTLFVATGDYGVLMTSTNGINWTTRVPGNWYTAYPITLSTNHGTTINGNMYSNFGRLPNINNYTSYTDFGYPFKKSTDGGATWTTLYTPPYSGNGYVRDFDVNGSTILTIELLGGGRVANTDYKLKKSTDGGSSWSYVTLPSTWTTNNYVPFSIKTTGSYWLMGGTGMGIYKSTDDGSNWTQVYNSANGYEFVRGNNIWIAWDSSTGHFTTSSDGTTWGGFNASNGTGVYDIANNGTLWVAVGSASGQRDYIKTSTDNGSTWTTRALSQWGNSVDDLDYLWGIVWAPSASRWVAWGNMALLAVSSDSTAATWSRTSLVTFGANAIYEWAGVFATSTQVVAYATLKYNVFGSNLTNPLFIKYVSTDCTNWYVNEIMYDMAVTQDLPTLDITLTSQPGSKIQTLPIPVVYS